MQAVTFEQLGGPEVLRLREIDEPQLRANQVPSIQSYEVIVPDD